MKNDAIKKENLYEKPLLDVYIPANNKNVFIGMEKENAELPLFCDIKDKLPRPFLTGREDLIDVYYKAWEIAFSNLKKCGNGFVKNYIDTAFNDYIFLWDSAFMTLFGRYANHIFNFQNTLDNFYCNQEIDGFIGRELHKETGTNRYHRFDPVSTGGNLFAWVEIEYYKQEKDTERLSNVFPVILAYHRWLKMHRTWQDGTYWSSGWGCGMDNQMRVSQEVYDYSFHDHLTWLDACIQQILSADMLIEMHKILNSKENIDDIIQEKSLLKKVVNEKLWDEKTGFYYDAKRDGTLVNNKSIGAYWALIAGICSENQKQELIAKLRDENEFMTKNPIPTMPKSNKYFNEDGDYWRGGVWAPMNYMVLKGLERNNCTDLSYEIARRHLDTVTKVYEETGTLWENYCPNKVAKGSPSKPNFVGWTGLSPISIFIEYHLGIKFDLNNNIVIWDINNLNEHGIENLYFNQKPISLHCKARQSKDEMPQVTVTGLKEKTLLIRWNNEEKLI